MSTWVLVAIATWVVISGINAAIAKAKNLNVAVVVAAGIVVTPVVVWMYVAGMPVQPRRVSRIDRLASTDTSWAQATSRAP